jgi:hypothetical protein
VLEAMVAQGGPEAHRAKAMLQWDRYTYTLHTPHTHIDTTAKLPAHRVKRPLPPLRPHVSCVVCLVMLCGRGERVDWGAGQPQAFDILGSPRALPLKQHQQHMVH